MRRWPRLTSATIVVPAILAPVVALVISVTLDDRFAAVAELSVGSSAFTPAAGTSGLDAHFLSSPAAPGTLKPMPRRWQGTVADRTARRLESLSGAEVFESVSLTVDPDRRVLGVTATATDAPLAARLANTFANEYVAFDREAYNTQVGSAREANRLRLAAMPRSVRGQAAERLVQRGRDLVVLEAAGSPQVVLTSAAFVPDEPVSPDPVRNTLVALAVGLLAGLGLEALRRDADGRPRRRGEN